MKRSLGLLCVLLAGGGVGLPVLAARENPLRHPLIEEVVAMVDGCVATDMILKRVQRMDAVPELDGHAIAKLTRKGVPRVVLLELIRRQEIAPIEEGAPKEAKESPRSLSAAVDPPIGASAPDRAVIAANLQNGSQGFSWNEVPSAAMEVPEPARTERGRIRVLAKSALPVTYLEVLLDGRTVARKGEVHEGETKPGWMLPFPPVLQIKGGAVVYETDVPPGRYDVQTTFALSRIVTTHWDPVLEAHGQRYDTATVEPADDEAGGSPVCEIVAGRTCTVRARLQKRGDEFAVRYDSSMH